MSSINIINKAQAFEIVKLNKLWIWEFGVVDVSSRYAMFTPYCIPAHGYEEAVELLVQNQNSKGKKWTVTTAIACYNLFRITDADWLKNAYRKKISTHIKTELDT